MNYVEKEELQREIEIAHMNDFKVFSEDLHQMVMIMTQRISRKSAYRDRSYREDMISSGYMKAMSVIHKYDINKTNPFSYLQSVIENHFKDTIKFNQRDNDYHTQLSNKLHNELSEEYQLRNEADEIEIESRYDESPSNLIIWKTSFLNMFYEDSDLPIYELIKEYFDFDTSQAEELISSEGEIIYFNEICDNVNGRCLCNKCKNVDFQNRLGKLLSIHRTTLIEMKGISDD